MAVAPDRKEEEEEGWKTGTSGERRKTRQKVFSVAKEEGRGRRKVKSARNIFRSTFESQNMACLKGVVPQLLPGMEDDRNFFA